MSKYVMKEAVIMKKDIIILTKSYKHNGTCVAGIDVTTGAWIRMMSSNQSEEGAVPFETIAYNNRTLVDIYDVVRIDFTRPCPNMIQPENWYYNEFIKWEFIKKSNINEVLNLHPYDSPRFIFQNTEKSLSKNTNFNCEPSLLIMMVLQPRIFIKTFEKKKVQFCFEYNRNQYDYFSITDPNILNQYHESPDATYSLGVNAAVIFSLTDKYDYNGKYYKVAAQFL
jgi:hypothetical protein